MGEAFRLNSKALGRSRSTAFVGLIGQRSEPRRARGFSLIELLITLSVSLILLAMSIPAMQSAVFSYRLRAAVSSATWAIQTTRYQAIMKGYSYQIVFSPSTRTYQVRRQTPGAASFTDVGGAVPISGSAVALSAPTTLQFKPNGAVRATQGGLSFAISYHGISKTITVSLYGNVSVQ